MTPETVSIRLPIYRDSEGNPTCAIRFHEEMTCFLFDFVMCNARPRGLREAPKIIDGRYVPLASCPLWSHASHGEGFAHSGENGVDCGCRT